MADRIGQQKESAESAIHTWREQSGGFADETALWDATTFLGSDQERILPSLVRAAEWFRSGLGDWAVLTESGRVYIRRDCQSQIRKMLLELPEHLGAGVQIRENPALDAPHIRPSNNSKGILSNLGQKMSRLFGLGQAHEAQQELSLESRVRYASHYIKWVLKYYFHFTPENLATFAKRNEGYEDVLHRAVQECLTQSVHKAYNKQWIQIVDFVLHIKAER